MTEPIGSFSGLASGIDWRSMIDQIVQMETQRQLTPLQTQSADKLAQKAAWNSLNDLLTSFSDASSTLRDGSAFSNFAVTAGKSPVSGAALVSASATEAASPGTYEVEVRSLARQQKVRADVRASSSDALGFAGTFSVNGQDVAISTGDSLAAIRDRINAANVGADATGVTASIVDVSDTEHYLTLTADATGANGIQLTDAGGVLGQLGISTDSESAQFTSDTTAVAQLLGLSPEPPVRTILVDGHEITVDLSQDTLQSLMLKINTAGGDAQVESTTDAGGTTTYSLSVQGDVWGKGDDADTETILSKLGFTRANEIAAGSQARVRIDGLDVVRSTNTISDALAGLTLDLQAPEPGQTVNLSVGRDVDAAVKQVQSFADAFNAIVDFQDEQRKSGAPLYANSSVRTMVGSLKDVLLTAVPGIPSDALNRLGPAGVSLDKEGRLEVDTDTLKSALTTNFSQVQDLFGTHGSMSASGFSLVGGTDATQAGSYSVQITHAATRAAVTGSGWTGTYTDDGSSANEITIADAYVAKDVTVKLASFDTTDELVAELNRQFQEQGLTLSASKSGTNLVIEGSKYGAAASFTVSYSRDGTTVGTSTIGLAAGTYAGTDVAGTIEGAVAIGSGQILSAADGSDAEGLSVQYAGTADSASSTATYILGAGGIMERLVEGYTRSGDGLIALNTEAIDESVSRLSQRQDDVQERLDRYEASLVKQFTAMESALSKLQSQGNWLTSQIQQLQGLNSQ